MATTHGFTSPSMRALSPAGLYASTQIPRRDGAFEVGLLAGTRSYRFTVSQKVCLLGSYVPLEIRIIWYHVILCCAYIYILMHLQRSSSLPFVSGHSTMAH